MPSPNENYRESEAPAKLAAQRFGRSLTLPNITIASAMACILFISPTCIAQNDDEFFEARVRPVLVTHCLDCHGPKKQEGGLRLDSRDSWMRGGDRGDVIVAGEPEKSLMIQAVRYNDPDLQMPPGNKKLSGTEIADLEAWVQRGAHDPRRESATQASEKMSLEQARTFWSFQALATVTPPQDTTDRWSRTALDAFIPRRTEEARTDACRRCRSPHFDTSSYI